MDRVRQASSSDFISLPLHPFDMFGLYQIEANMGEGVTASVYRAYHVPTGMMRVLKILRSEFHGDRAMRFRFDREGMILSRVCHPGIVRLCEQGETNGLAYLALEYVSGSTLREVLSLRKRLKPHYAVELAAQAGEALAFAQGYHGVTHGDVRPENVLITPFDAPPWLVLMLDFGMARLQTLELPGTMAQDEEIVGAPEYMAPEVIRGDLDRDGRMDIYALGAVLYESITGVLPYPSRRLEELLVLHMETSPLPLSQFLIEPHVGLNEVILQALAIDPAKRFPTMQEFAASLRSLQQRG